MLLAGAPASNFAAAALEKNEMEEAVKAGNLVAVQELVLWAGGIDVRFCKKNAYTCLIDGADYGQEEIVDFCIRNGANLDMQDKHGRTALMWSLIYRTHLDNFCTTEKEKALCRFRKLKVFYALLSHGADYSMVTLAGKSVIQYINGHHQPLAARIIDHANKFVSERVYRVCKILSEQGNLVPGIILDVVLPYMYGGIEAHNKHPDKFLTVDRDRFFRQKLARVLGDRRRLYSDKHAPLRLAGPITKKKAEREVVINFTIEDHSFSEGEMVSAEPMQEKNKWSCFSWCLKNN